ncbi:MAG TPA: biosynthetic peptidoglycan transglycosylase [Longimicrobium sp.]
MSRGVPPVGRLRAADPGVTAYMRVRARETGAPPPATEWTPLDQVSPYLAFAVVKAEDPRFFRHRGIHWRSVADAAWGALRGWGARGASTLTQQLARNLYLSPARSVGRKAREAILALRMERALDKARILELYLNVVEWGDGTWGVAQAARRWMDRRPAELDAHDAALLAALLPAPRRALEGNNANRAWWVQRYVLFQLYHAGHLTADEWRAGVARATSLCRLTHAGVALDEAVRRVREALPAPVPERRGLEMGALLADGFGVDRHVLFHETVRTWERLRRRPSARVPAPSA